MKLKISTLLLISAVCGIAMAEEQSATAAAASQPAASGTEAATPTVLVAVNGQPVTDADVLAFNALQGNKQPLNTEQGQMQVMNQLINTALIAQVATAHKLQDDPQVAAAIQMATMQVLAEEGRTMIGVTHEMSFARNVSTHVIFMHEGTICEQGPPDEMFAHPKTEPFRRFIADIGS